MCTRRIAAGIAAALAIALPAQADTVASLLGNFTVNQYAGLRVSERAIGIRYSVVYGQLPALRELHTADTDGNGVTTQAERDAHAKRLSQDFARGFTLTENGRRVPLRASAWSTSLPTEDGGFSLRLDVDLAGDLAERGPRTIAFANENFPRQFGWHEIAVSSAPGIAVYDTDAFSTSLTDGLLESPRELPASGPLSERRVHFAFSTGALPAGAVPIAPRAGKLAVPAPDEDAGGWLREQTRRIADLIGAPGPAPGAAALALLAAMVLGALHAFAPGHGKTVVGAYLVGSRATARHAAFLGLTVTVTHTVGVFVLGFATLFASAYVVPERIFPVLGFVSGLVVLGMGVTLAIRRWPAAREALRGRGFRAVDAQGSFLMGRMQHAHAAAGWHSHGGTSHTHASPPDRVTWRSLLALGVSGGLVPCPSAMVLLLAAVALGKTAFGLALVVAFSAGLAMTLTAVGLAFLYARNRLPGGARAPRWTRIVPLASAAAIALIGALLCRAALTGGPV
jgi:ABC-type nickel/cobalt efflux system permease component RcnA